MKPSRVCSVLQELLTSRWAVFIWGPPGAGKSSVVKQIAQSRGMPLLDIRASLLDPTDLRGIPAAVDGRAVWYPPSFLPRAGDKPGILFFDELNAAPPLVQASLYQLILDQRVGEYQLPEGWRIVAAGNRSEDASVTFRMPAALANRFIHIDFEIDFDDWRDWAIDARIHPLVMGFLGLRRELLFDMKSPERGFPTPRSWEIVSDTLSVMGAVEACSDILPGIIGQGAAIEFLAYCHESISEQVIKDILKDPEHAPLPEDLGSLYALISYIASRGKDKTVTAPAGMLLHRLPPEPAVLLIRDILKQAPGFVQNKGYQAFVRQHKDLFVS
jgi:hypothetical protein